MEDETERIVSRSNPQRAPLVLPDGTQPQPLGSGSITGIIGSGGMSNVYKIWNPQLESLRAVKLMKPDLNIESQQRFQTEIKIMAALSHPNIIKIHSVGEWNALAFIEMEFVDGFTLAEIIAKKGALPIPVCLSIAIMIARALVYAHSKEYVLYGKKYTGIIHRDLKPSNIMLAKDGRVLLMDFGIARPVETSLMTMDGAVMGTMQYLAPEQIDGINVGVTADLYSLGAVLYETLTGKKAFPQKNLSQLMAYKTENHFIPLRMFKTPIPGSLTKLVDKCMMHDPDKRIPTSLITVHQLEHLLKRITADDPEIILRSFMQSPIDTKTELHVRSRVPVAGIVIAVLSTIAVAAGIFFIVHSANQPMQPVQPATISPLVKKHVDTAAPPKPLPVRIQQPDRTAVAVKKKTVYPVPATPVTALVETVKVQIPAPSPKSGTYIDNMEEKYGISDSIELMINEAGTGNYQSVLKIINELSAQQQSSDQARLLQLRSLFATGNNTGVTAFFERTVIEDGEYYLIKAKYLFGQGSAALALAPLEKSVKTGTLLLDAESLRRDYLYYRASCFSSFFERAPGKETCKTALDGWFEVKNLMRSSPSHEYYQKAVVEMQKLGLYAADNKR